MKKTVAAVIPVKNVEKIIRGTLESLKFCDEVILVDMYSTDKTKEIALSYPNVKFYERESYIFANFNYGMDQANSEWVIRLDSDERLEPELQAEIQDLLKSDQTLSDVYKAPYLSYFLGKPLYHGNKFSTREVFFKKGSLRYPEKSEHEHLAPVDNKDLKYSTLQGMYHHFSCPSIKKYIDKINYYSEKDYERYEQSEYKRISPMKMLYIVFRFFIRHYLKYKGYKDGYHGFSIAALDACYLLIHLLKGWEKAESIKDFHDKVRDDYDEMLSVKSLPYTRD